MCFYKFGSCVKYRNVNTAFKVSAFDPVKAGRREQTWIARTPEQRFKVSSGRGSNIFSRLWLHNVHFQRGADSDSDSCRWRDRGDAQASMELRQH